MRGRHCSRTTALFLVLLVVALTCGADAKKRRKKHEKKRPHYSPPAPAPQVAWQEGPSRPAPSASSAQLQQQQSQKAQLEQAVAKYSAENKDVVVKHNKLVSDYNSLLKSHMGLIKKYNVLIEELHDPSIATFLSAKAIQISHHPGIEGAVNKTVIHVLPLANEALLTSQQAGVEWFNKTQAKVSGFLQAYGGESSQDWVPSVSGFIVYGSVMIPLIIACYCVLEFVCKLHKLILFGHVYLAVSGLSMAAFAASTGEDPLSTFAEHDWQLYQFAQIAFAIVFVLYGIVSCSALFCFDSNGSWRGLHVVATLMFGLLYYNLVWTPAMVDELPGVDDFIESLYMPEAVLPKGGAAAVVGAKGSEDEVPVLVTMLPYVVIAAVFGMLFILDASPQDGSDEGKDEEHKGQ